MRSGNPALKEDTFLDLHSGTVVGRNAQAMSLNGTVNKTGLLLLLAVLTAAFPGMPALMPLASCCQRPRCTCTAA